MAFRKLIYGLRPPGSPATWNMFAALKLRVASVGRAPLFIRCLPGLPVVLGGGFKYCLFSTLPGGMIQFDLYFSMGLKPPTRVGLLGWVVLLEKSAGKCLSLGGMDFLSKNGKV